MEVIKSIVLNISLLVILAQILASVKLVKKYIVREKHKTKEYIILIAILAVLVLFLPIRGILGAICAVLFLWLVPKLASKRKDTILNY